MTKANTLAPCRPAATTEHAYRTIWRNHGDQAHQRPSLYGINPAPRGQRESYSSSTDDQSTTAAPLGIWAARPERYRGASSRNRYWVARQRARSNNPGTPVTHQSSGSVLELPSFLGSLAATRCTPNPPYSSALDLQRTVPAAASTAWPPRWRIRTGPASRSPPRGRVPAAAADCRSGTTPKTDRHSC